MWKKVPDPTNPGAFVDARPIEVTGGNLNSSITAELADGTKLTLTIQVTEISIIEGRKDSAGKPIYNLDTSAQLKVEIPSGG